MSFLSKVRTLVGALVHKPFTPRPEEAHLDQPVTEITGEQRAELEGQEAGVAETERVADLIARQKQEESG